MIRKTANLPFLTAILFLVFCFVSSASGDSSGRAGYSGKTAGRICTSCHSTKAGTTATLTGPTSVASGSTNTYTVTINGPGTAGGIDVASTAGTFSATQTGTKILSGELVHSTPSTSKSWTFSWIAPTVTSNTSTTMYAAGVDSQNGGTGATTMAVTVTAAAPLPTLNVSPSSLTFSYTTGAAAPAAQTFAVSSSGAALTYTVSTSGGTWLSATGAGTTPSNVSVSVNPAGLAAGTYTGTVSVTSSGASNSPQNVAVTLTVTSPPNLTVSSASLTFTYTTGGTIPAAQTVVVGSSGAALAYTASTSGGTWLSASGGGTTPGNVSVSVNPAGLTAGTYTGSVNVTAAAAANSPQSVAVTLTVTSPPNLAVSPNSLSFSYLVGGTIPGAQAFSVSSSGAALTYTVAASGGTWLSASGGGTTPGSVSVSVNPSGLAAGTYNGTVSVTAAGAANSPQSVAVTLTVTNPSLTLNPASLSFIYSQGGTAPAAQTISVGSTGAALTYTVSSSGGTWLSATGGGTTPGSVSVSVDPSTLSAGTYTGTVSVTSAGAPNSPQNVAVTLTVTSAGTSALGVSPASLAFTFTIGATTPAAQTFTVTSSGSALTYSVATSGGSWLSGSGGGTTPGNVSVSISPAGLAAGTYNGTVSVMASGAANSPQNVAVTLTVTSAPNLVLNPTSLSFAYTIGATTPISQSFSVTSSGAAVSYTVTTSGGAWLSASSGGTTPGNVSVSINTTGLTAGTYTGSVSITATGAANSPQSVAVTLTVIAAPNLSVTPGSLSFTFTTGGTPPASQSFAVSSSEAALTYTVSTSGGTWLSASGGGTTPGNVTVSIKTTGLTAGTYNGIVSVAASGAGNTPQSVAVTLIVANPPNLTISPSSLAFSYTIGDMVPASQAISVGSSGTALSYTVATSGGTWLSATGAGMTPGSVNASVNPGTLAAGSYTGTVTITGTGSSNGPQTVAVSLTVSAAPDTTPPSVSITSPAAYAVLAGVIELSAVTSDDVGVVGVSYQVDGKQVGTEIGTAPYKVAWDTSGVSNGIHVIIATARDAAGNTSIDNMNVQVSNSGMSSGGLLGTLLDTNTKFQVQQNGISTLISCVTCWFAGPSDLLPGQVLEVRLRAGASPDVADVVVLKQQTIDGSITQVGNSQFTLRPSDSHLPTSVIVITGNATNLNGVTPAVGQQISARGILLKNSPSGGPTLIATIVELQ